MPIKGNKGEWSEFYTFLRLITDKQITAADENLEKISEIFYPILKIIREESSVKTDYEFTPNSAVKILQTGTEVAVVDSADLRTKVVEIFHAIKEKTDTTFEVPVADELMERFRVTRLGAGNSHKEDITLKIHDRMTGAEPEVGFSVKSMLGSPATLLNASSATNFIYKISSLNQNKINEINSITTKAKIRDRLSAILENGGIFSFVGVDSDNFTRNLRMVDTVLPEIMAELLLAYYSDKGRNLPELVTQLGNDSTIKILNFNLSCADYEFKIKGLLHNIALGMVPSKEWDGLLRAHGGYIVVREDGEIVCYHVYNADQFRNYLFKNTRLETASTGRHGFGSIYEKNGELFIKLNLQIRFIK